MLNDLKVSAFLATRSLKRGSRGSFVLNILIIAMVFTNMILLPSIITGSVMLFNEQTINYQTSDIIISPKSEERYIEDASALLDKINRIPGVLRASARYQLGSTINFESKSVSIPITAFQPSDETEVTLIHTKMRDGNFLSSADTGEIILGSYAIGNEDESKDFLKSLGAPDVGDSVTVSFENGERREYRIKGIFETKSYQTDYTGFITWDEMENVLGTEIESATSILVKTENPEDVDKVKLNLISYGVSEEVKTWEEALSKIVEESVETFNIINDITMLVSLIIAVVVLFIVIMIKAINNRRQIGILKAIGINKQIIINSYVFQVLIICILGIILGLILVRLLTFYFTLYPMKFPDGDVVPHVETSLLIENAISLLIASAIAGYVPAWRITKENILDAMRR
ncbi:ABC transporter permease [Methanoplanus sp. FWC-SCC4]|uniref:ABC transporter permease n=1 Tax=Methanochimaera problematica TaxID=2609417 RepID=A0AA97I4W6_9EURY|nr:FtsX-like permease family protein [Methanoplanus sp. FWC-SCC4]WOF16919.1 ABC transporter permease [Methanoplanus sp. FWC-SCC4]